MNKVSLNSKVSLLEIILSVLIFAAAGIIMLNCFGIARFTQVRANDKVKAGAIIQSDFEIIKSFNTAKEMYVFLNNSYEKSNTGSNKYAYKKYYDKNWRQSSIDKEYVVTIVISDENLKSGNLIHINISAEKENPYPFTKKEGLAQVFSLESKKLFPDSGGSYGN